MSDRKRNDSSKKNPTPTDPTTGNPPQPPTAPELPEAARASDPGKEHRGRHRRLWHRAIVVGGSAAAIAAVAYLAAPPVAGARGWFGQPGCQGHGAPGEPDPTAMRHRILYMAERALDEIEVAEGQRETVLGIVGRAADDLAELQGDREELRAAFVDALLKPTVDREALEALRMRKLETIAAVSEGLVAAVADVAQVLSVEQREKLAAYIRSRHEERWGHSHRL